MKIRIHAAGPDDLEAFYEIVALVYRGGAAVAPESRTTERVFDFIAYADGRPAGIFRLVPYDTVFGDNLLATGGVALVGVHPEFRRNGVGKAMLEFAVKEQFRMGFALSGLYPFSEAYYRQFGYATAGNYLVVNCPLRELPEFRRSLPCRLVRESVVEVIGSCYDAFAKRRSGYAARTEYLWKRALAGGETILTFVAGDPVEAYAVVSMDGSFYNCLEVRELVYSSLEGYSSIMSMLKDLAVNKSGITWKELSTGPFMTHFARTSAMISATAPVNASRGIMFRALDVAKMLDARVPRSGLGLRIEVRDPFIPGNNGVWDLSEGHANTTSAGADITVDISLLSQFLMGVHNPHLALSERLVECSSDAAAEEFCRLMPTREVGCLDFY